MIDRSGRKPSRCGAGRTDCASAASGVMEDNLPCRSRAARSNYCHGKQNFKRRKAISQFLDLPEDMLCKILSGLPLKEVVRTSVLSSKWRHVRTINPKLRFDGMTMCSSTSIYGSKQCTQELIHNINIALKQHNGMFVKDFEIKFELRNELVIHLDNWVRFVAASQTKNLAFDLVPAEFCGRDDRYFFPFELLDCGSTLRLQRIQLGFVSIKLPSQFSGFPNLRKLDLHLARVTAKDIEDMLSSSSSLEWLSMVRCHLDDELQVDFPLPGLLYLCVADCMITRIKFNAMNLKTFVYRGWRYPIDLTQSLDLKDAHLHFFDLITLEHALTVLPTALPSVKILSLQAYAPLKVPMMLENTSKFSQLKYLLLELAADDDNILSLASYLKAAPRVEKFELHLCSSCYFPPTIAAQCFRLPTSWDSLRSLPRCPHIYLKDLYITGFTASSGQLEFLLHTVENAPVLEVLTLDPAFKFDNKVGTDYEGQTDFFFSQPREISRRHLGGRISPTTKLCIL